MRGLFSPSDFFVQVNVSLQVGLVSCFVCGVVPKQTDISRLDPENEKQCWGNCRPPSLSPKQALKLKFSKFSKVVTVQAVTVEKSLQNGFFCAVDIDPMKSKLICSAS